MLPSRRCGFAVFGFAASRRFAIRLATGGTIHDVKTGKDAWLQA